MLISIKLVSSRFQEFWKSYDLKKSNSYVRAQSITITIVRMWDPSGKVKDKDIDNFVNNNAKNTFSPLFRILSSRWIRLSWFQVDSRSFESPSIVWSMSTLVNKLWKAFIQEEKVKTKSRLASWTTLSNDSLFFIIAIVYCLFFISHSFWE